MQANGLASSAAQAPTVERLERDEGALTDEQRMSAVMADAPELAALLSELQGSLAEVRSHVGPVLKEVRAPCAVLCCCVALESKVQPVRLLQESTVSKYAICVCIITGKVCSTTAGNVHIAVQAAGLAAATVISLLCLTCDLYPLIFLLFVCICRLSRALCLAVEVLSALTKAHDHMHLVSKCICHGRSEAATWQQQRA